MANTLLFVCFFVFIIIIKYNARAQLVPPEGAKLPERPKPPEGPKPPEERKVEETKWGEKKFLVVVEFENNYQCLGALVSTTSLVTSKICLDYYRFSSKISEKPCKVLAGSQETVGKDLGIWRFCIRAHQSLWGDNLDYTKRGIRIITFDLPFADMETASVEDPPFGGNSNCEVHGFSSGKGAAPSAESESKASPAKLEQPPPEPAPEPLAKFRRDISNHITKAEGSQSVINKNGLEQSQEISHNKISSNKVTPAKEDNKRLPKSSLKQRREPSKSEALNDGAKSYKKTKAIILGMNECTKMYRENMDVDLPPDQFCVSEGGITDPGRLLICNDKIVGIVADDLAIKKDGNNIIYAYKFASRQNRLILDPKVVWSLITVHFVYKIF